MAERPPEPPAEEPPRQPREQPPEPLGEILERYWRAVQRYLRVAGVWLAARGRDAQRGAVIFWRWLRTRVGDIRAGAGAIRRGRDDDEAGEPEVAAVPGARGPRLPGATTIVAERDDDASSIIGRIDTASEVDLLLVVPRRAQGLRDAMEWPRIAGYVRQRGLRVRVLTSRGEVREHAESAGLPAARTVRGLRPRPSLSVPFGSREFVLRLPPVMPLIKAGAFVAVVVLVVAATCTYVPSAEILIAPPSEPLSTSARVRISPVGGTDVGLGVIAATSVQITVVSVVSTTTTGTTTVGDEPATAELTFSNEGEVDIDLPIGTPVDDEGGFTFTTDGAVTVPAGESATVAATALRPGTGGNLEADSLRLLIGFPPTLTVTNLAAAEGGSDTEVPAVSPIDVVTVGELAETVLRRAGERELVRVIKDATVFTETISVAILSQAPLAQVGEATDLFLIEYTAVVSALALLDAEADRAAEQLLQAQLPEGMALLPGTTVAAVGGNTAFDGSRLTVDFTATGLATPLFDPTTLRGQLTNVSPEVAAERLREQLGLVEAPLITVHPTWLPDWRMPRRSGRISIELVSPEALAAAIAGEPAEPAEGELGEGEEDGADATGGLLPAAGDERTEAEAE